MKMDNLKLPRQVGGAYFGLKDAAFFSNPWALGWFSSAVQAAVWRGLFFMSVCLHTKTCHVEGQHGATHFHLLPGEGGTW